MGSLAGGDPAHLLHDVAVVFSTLLHPSRLTDVGRAIDTASSWGQVPRAATERSLAGLRTVGALRDNAS